MEEIKRVHKEKFGKWPVLIGMFFSNPEQTRKNILKAIKENKPYNEYNILTDKEKEEYDNGTLLF